MGQSAGMLASASAFAVASSLAPTEEEALELTERDLWEDDAGDLLYQACCHMI